jgi:hypothetical protein
MWMAASPPNNMPMPKIRSGLVSISFRKVEAGDLIEEVVKAGQRGIEWGGDVHVPHGDTRKAEQVARWTRDAGLESAAYGSYYRLADEDSPEIEAVLDSAEALAAPTVRTKPTAKRSRAMPAGFVSWRPNGSCALPSNTMATPSPIRLIPRPICLWIYLSKIWTVSGSRRTVSRKTFAKRA